MARNCRSHRASKVKISERMSVNAGFRVPVLSRWRRCCRGSAANSTRLPNRPQFRPLSSSRHHRDSNPSLRIYTYINEIYIHHKSSRKMMINLIYLLCHYSAKKDLHGLVDFRHVLYLGVYYICWLTLNKMPRNKFVYHDMTGCSFESTSYMTLHVIRI